MRRRFHIRMNYRQDPERRYGVMDTGYGRLVGQPVVAPVLGLDRTAAFALRDEWEARYRAPRLR